MYITYVQYVTLYDPIDEPLFNRLAFEACRVMDIHTTGIDNVKKLRLFFPSEEYAAQAVMHCAAGIINLLNQIRIAEVAALESRGVESTEQGVRGRVITSVSAGNESISYSTGGSGSATAIDAAVGNRTVRDKMIAEIVWEYLAGVQDANGVNLLFMGMYPRRYVC